MREEHIWSDHNILHIGKNILVKTIEQGRIIYLPIKNKTSI